MHALGLEFGSAAQLSKRPGSVWNCLWGNALKRSPGIIRKSRVSYPGPGFLSSATWPSLPKKHYNGLNQTKPNPFLDYNILSIFHYLGSPLSFRTLIFDLMRNFYIYNACIYSLYHYILLTLFALKMFWNTMN